MSNKVGIDTDALPDVEVNTKSKEGKTNSNGQLKQVEENAETEAVEKCCPCVKKIKHKMWFKCCVFLLVFGLDAIDLVCDWWLFKDVFMTEEGLVYGPPSKVIIWCLLAFSVLGTVTFVFEIANLWWEVFRQNPWVDSDLASALTIWIEDVPQIILNVIIVLCREEAISYLQLVKASVMILGICIRIIVSLVRYCGKENLAKANKKTAWARRHVAYRVLIMFGLIIIFVGSATIFFCTQFERDIDGKIKFNIPHTIFEGKFDDERYFDNVSIYFNHPYIDYDSNPNWLRLITIYDVREKKSETFKIELDDATKTKFTISQTGNSNMLDLKECYTIDKTAKTLTNSGTCTSNHITGNKIKIIFKFKFIETDIPYLIFGDIEFNTKVHKQGKPCNDPVARIVNDVRNRNIGSIVHPVIHYYRTKSAVTQTHHTVWETASTRFFKDTDLIDITSVWKTGFGSCKSSGSLAPHQKSNIKVDCSV